MEEESALELAALQAVRNSLGYVDNVEFLMHWRMVLVDLDYVEALVQCRMFQKAALHFVRVTEPLLSRLREIKRVHELYQNEE